MTRENNQIKKKSLKHPSAGTSVAHAYHCNDY